MITSPCIGRQGKTLRRRQQRKVEPLYKKESCPNIDPTDPETGK